jgi:uncharacterized protein YgbK (DUF1537 family)
MRATGRKLIILDDDPLGCQTVYDLPIVTDWSAATLRAELAGDAPACFVLTNSRSMPAGQAERVYEGIGRRLSRLEAQTGQAFNILTRCDSTLRGHFPGEIEALQRGMNRPFSACLFIPFFAEGGRLTINDVHYITEDKQLIPIGQSSYAQDAVFGFQASNLREWVAEKTNGRIIPQHIPSISLADIRQGGPERVAGRLRGLDNGLICIVNAAEQRDIEVFVQGLLLAEAAGKRFLYRTAASFIPARLGLPPRPLLTASDLDLPASGGGLIIVGSHVPQTTSQLQALLAMPGLHSTEVRVPALLDEHQRQAEIERVVKQVESGLGSQQDVVIYTSRQPVQGKDIESSLQLGRQISGSLAAITRLLSTRPRYLLVKGGITASDLATQALQVQRAIVLGQLMPGVPVWRLGSESRFPHLCFIVFPGNVGDTQALVTAVSRLSRAQKASENKLERVNPG